MRQKHGVALALLVAGFALLSAGPASADPAPGTVVAWGCTGAPADTCAVPASLPASAVKLAAGDDSTLALMANGTVQGWGCTVFPAFQCTVSGSITTATAIATGDYHSLVAKADGTVAPVGCDIIGGDYGQCDVPVGLTGVTAVAAGYSSSLALKSNGSVVAWGCINADWGQCTVPAAATSHIVGIAAGEQHSLAVNDSGVAIAWGCVSANFGQCTVPAPAQSGVTAVAAGWYHSLALKSDGTVVAWGCAGNTDHGQCSVPIGLDNVVAISAGESSSLALKSDGTVVAWGCTTTRDYGQCTVPAGHYSAIAAGHYGSFGVAAAAAFSTKNLVGNGGFERPNEGGGGATLNAGKHVGAWTITGGSIDIVPTTYWPSASGLQSIDLNGLSPGTISQDVTVPDTGSYRIAFRLAGNPECGKAIKRFDVLWNGSTVLSKRFDTTGHTVSDMGWKNVRVTVNATAGPATLAFASTTAGACGPALDQVTVKRVA